MTSWDSQTGVGHPQDLQCDQYWVGLGGWIDIIQYFPPKTSYFLVVQKIVEATLWARMGLRKRALKQEGRGQSTTFERMT